MRGPGVKVPNFAMEIPHFSVKIPNFAIFPTNAYGPALLWKRDSQSMYEKQLKAYPLGFDEMCFCSMFERVRVCSKGVASFLKSKWCGGKIIVPLHVLTTDGSETFAIVGMWTWLAWPSHPVLILIETMARIDPGSWHDLTVVTTFGHYCWTMLNPPRWGYWDSPGAKNRRRNYCKLCRYPNFATCKGSMAGAFFIWVWTCEATSGEPS